MKLLNAMVFPNLMVACFGGDPSEQVPEAQMNLLELWAIHVAALGYDPDGAIIETQGASFKLAKKPECDGYRVIPIAQQVKITDYSDEKSKQAR